MSANHSAPLHLEEKDFHTLLRLQGPSLGLWRAAEVAALREQEFPPPVLDLGCGDGLVTSLVLPRVDIGLDPNQEALGQASRRGIYTRLQPVPVEAADLPPGSIGSVLSNSVLEHVEDIDRVLEAAARLLCPGGRLVFTAPTEAFSAWLALPLTGYAAWRNRHYDHLNLWTLEHWSARLERAGLRIESVRPYLRRRLVAAWDLLELSQRVWVGRRRLVGVLWQRIPPATMKRLARRASRLDLSAKEPGGGRLIVAVKE